VIHVSYCYFIIKLSRFLVIVLVCCIVLSLNVVISYVNSFLRLLFFCDLKPYETVHNSI